MRMKNFISLLMMGIFLVGCGEATLHPRTLVLNKEGNKNLKDKNAQEASDKYLAALRFNPYQAELHLNLGLSFEFLQFPDKALQSYKYADQLAQQEGHPELSFAARFNAGQLLGKAKRVDEALDYYQKALDIHPASIETKHNIELLTQQNGQGGQGEGKDQKDQGEKGQDQKKDGDGQGDQKKDKPQDGKDPKDDKEKESKPQEKQQSAKYKPRPFDGKELDEHSVKKILGEIKQQEQRIRADFNRKEQKEQPRDKDW